MRGRDKSIRIVLNTPKKCGDPRTLALPTESLRRHSDENRRWKTTVWMSLQVAETATLYDPTGVASNATIRDAQTRALPCLSLVSRIWLQVIQPRLVRRTGRWNQKHTDLGSA